MPANPKTDAVTVPYIRSVAPGDPSSLNQYLWNELQKLQDTLAVLNDSASQATDVAPRTPKRGMQRYAFGAWAATMSGEGQYVYKSTGWTKIA